MEQNLDITNKFPQSLGTSLNRGSTVHGAPSRGKCLRVEFAVHWRGASFANQSKNVAEQFSVKWRKYLR